MDSYKSLKRFIRQVIKEGLHDKYNNKLILFFGPPGSGKSTFIRTLKSYGLKHSTPDDILEFLIDKNFVKKGKATDVNDAFKKYPEDIFSSGGIRGQSLNKATKRVNIWKSLPLGIVMEGTGGAPLWYKENIIIPFQEIEYEIMIVMLYEDLQTCIDRNVSRGQQGGRNLPPDLVTSLFDGFINNYDEFKSLAAQNNINFITISDDHPDQLSTSSYYDREQGLKEIKRFLEK